MLMNSRKNYLRLRKKSKFGNQALLDAAAREMIQMKEYGINGNYMYDFYPYPAPNRALNAYTSSFGEDTIVGGTETGPDETGGGNIYITSSFGMSPELQNQLSEMGIIGNYQYDLFPYPAPNKQLMAQVSSFGNKKKSKKKSKRKLSSKRKSSSKRK